MKSCTMFLLSSIVTLGILNASAHADLVVSNTGNAFDGAWIIGTGSTLADSPVANQFTTGSGPGWTLNSVDLNLGVTGSPSGNILAYLAADSGGLPGTPLVFFSGTNPTTSMETLTYTPLAATTLAANSSYWIVLSSNVSDNYVWNYTTDTSETGLPGWSIGNTAYAGAPSGTWTALDSIGDPAPTLFQVNATPVTAVPEPSSLALGITGAAFAGLAVHRRRRGSAA